MVLNTCFDFSLILLGKGGRVASGISLSQFVSKNLAVKNLDDSNPRESILRHAKVCFTIFVLCG